LASAKKTKSSALEDEFLVRFCLRHPDLTEPEQEFEEIEPWLTHLEYRKSVESSRCRKWRADFCWPQEKVIVELQGGVWFKGQSGHGNAKGLLRDYAKAVTAQAAGWLFFPLAAPHVKEDRYLDLIANAIRQRRPPGQSSAIVLE